MHLKIFLLEMTMAIEAKHVQNVYQKVLYQNGVYGANLKSKMAATEEQNLTLDPMGNTPEDLLGIEASLGHKCSLERPSPKL